MPKHEALTPKAIANRIKSKGLQKLKWYCQMCQKQCRDENGFKCHTLSEAHQRQMLIFGENSVGFMSSFTRDFEIGYLDHLRRMHGTKRTFANLVYQEYIKDRDHIHMNATDWKSLTDFVQYLGKTGKCTVDHTEKGWYVTWIDRDPETLARQAKLKRLEKKELDDEERMQLAIERMMESDAGNNTAAFHAETEFDSGETHASTAEFQRVDEDDKIAIELVLKSKPATGWVPISTIATGRVASVFQKPLIKSVFAEKKAKTDSSTEKISTLSATDNLLGDEIRFGAKKRHISDADSSSSVRSKISKKHEAEKNHSAEAISDAAPWLMRGIVVKLITSDLGAAYVKRKAVVKEVLDDRYTAVVQLEDGDYNEAGQRVKIDQTHVETVIPKLGRNVLFVRGRNRGDEAEMIDIDYKKFCVAVKLKSGRPKGEIIENVAYDHVCKVA